MREHLMIVTLLAGSLVVAAALPAPAYASGAWQVKEIYIARHGQTEWNRVGRVQGDPDLNARGYEHRVALYLALRDVGLERIYTSALLRTRRTGALTARMLDIDASADARLNELHGGIFEGICYSTVDNEEKPTDVERCRPGGPADPKRPEIAYLRTERAKRTQDKASYRPPGGESYLDGAKRVKKFLQANRRQLKSKKVLVVGHAGSNRLLLSHLMGWSTPQVVRIRQDNDWIFRVRPGDDGQLQLSLWRDGSWRPCAGEPDPTSGLECAR